LSAALPLLREAFADAEELGRDHWEFALTAGELLSAGLRGTDLRWLAAHALVTHAVEAIRRRCGQRVFCPAPDLALTERSCFVLTDAGRRFADGLLAGEASRPGQTGSGTLVETPRWDAATRELTWKGRLVKRFRTPSHCQERLLTVFEEERWPARIDDPLEVVPGLDPAQRLHDAVRRLNGNQREARVRFTRDGTGKGVCWSGA
jgi:hypothetical protein